MLYTESAQLMQDLDFRGRIKVACLKYGTFILGEPADTTAHSSRYKWATNTAQSPDAMAASIQPMVVMDDAVQTSGAQIDDPGLQTAVETVVNKMI